MRPAIHWGFTLIELLVCLVIIVIVSAVALPTILPALNRRQTSEATRLIQAAIVGARDVAIRTHRPSGIRLLPDPVFSGINSSTGMLDPNLPLAFNRIIPLSPAPDYDEGLVSVFTATTYVNQIQSPTGAALFTPTLVLEQEFGKWINTALPGNPPAYIFMPNPPTNWFWNVRVGDKIQINNAGPWYTVVGPVWNGFTTGNVELFTNVGVPGAPLPLSRTYTSPTGQSVTPNVEYLLLANGADDNANGWIDEGWDGVDNDHDNLIDETTCPSNPQFGEWEAEAWPATVVSINPRGASYTIRRRMSPSPNAREIALPTTVVIDATTWNTTQERSRIPSLNQYTGYADIMVNPDGTILPTTLYSAPTAFNMGSAFFHLWISDRKDVASPTGTLGPFLPIPDGTAVSPPTPTLQQHLRSDYALVTITSRTGNIATNESMPFDLANAWTIQYNQNTPFIQAQQGSSMRP